MALSRQVILETALQLLDEVGLDKLTLQRIADVLGVQTPALYWHIKNKRELLAHMADELVRSQFEDFAPPRPGEPWDQCMVDLARRIYRTLLSRRDGARLFAGAHLQHGFAQRSLENVLAALRSAGFTTFEALTACSTLVNYTTGTVIEQQSVASMRASGAKEAPQADGIPGGPDELSTAEVSALFNQEAMFERGLEIIVAGMGAKFAREVNPAT
ncbi:TetR/AcrR family transcriptional regulator C-terminal domain-containing protein [Amycolatopsis sp. H20-H5]|uniref:TetR/AcrR family transcriptional regulator C-terminal domain-containing protein n=1 Tax=Amycolatopsis sp. H20-H5 TaxID=3046309 RepID=UPI002DBB4F3C|nr:TetR/AcrR family transcriptional regulator C-terminal domain-containing protein [Amycolatopsis sp. H20-H5]MEC3975238.1 TetR/AcrR family transcriptional regulator C-terminal domain-containing protein [Amycolatopsis sp. H20-H5]